MPTNPILEITTTLQPPDGRAAIQALFGNPANHDGTGNTVWESANIEPVLPTGWNIFYQDDGGLVPLKKGIRMHRLIVPNFTAAMDEIRQFAKARTDGTEAAANSFLHQNRLDITGGGYNFRKITAGTSLSLHAYGIAIDWDPLHNPRQKPLTKTLPDWWYGIWQKHGFSNGCHFPTPDPMHVQFATGA